MDKEALLKQSAVYLSICLGTTIFALLKLHQKRTKMTMQCLALLLTTFVSFGVRVSRLLLVTVNDTSLDKRLLYFLDYFLQATMFLGSGLYQARILAVFCDIIPWITSKRLKIAAGIYCLFYASQIAFYCFFDEFTNFKTRAAWHISMTNLFSMMYLAYGLLYENSAHMITILFLYKLHKLKKSKGSPQSLFFLFLLSSLMILSDLTGIMMIGYGLFHPQRSTVGQFWILLGCNGICIYISLLCLFSLNLDRVLPRKKSQKEKQEKTPQVQQVVHEDTRVLSMDDTQLMHF